MDIDVGEIERIKIWHDDSGVGSAWLLDSVIIRKKHSTCRPITNVYIQRLEQISKALYRQAYEQIKKDLKVQTSSTKDYDRGILRSPTDRASLQKKVRWEEQSFGSQDEQISTDTKRTKNIQKTIEQKYKTDDLLQQIESGHFDHQAYWISSHNYKDKKWQIRSIEERNSFDLDQSTCSLLLSDRLTISGQIKTTINERDDDVYEFEANRWLAKDKNDGKLEVYLIPKSMKLSTHTTNEIKLRSSSPLDKINDSKKKHIPSDFQHDDEHSKRSSQFDLGPLERSPRNLASLDRSPHHTSKSQFDDLRSSQRSQQNFSNTLKRQEESSIDNKYHRPSSRTDNDLHTPSASQRELLAKISNESSYHSRSAATSLIDTQSSALSNQRPKLSRFDHEPTSSLTSNRDLSTKTSAEPPFRPKSTVRPPHELSSHGTTRSKFDYFQN